MMTLKLAQSGGTENGLLPLKVQLGLIRPLTKCNTNKPLNKQQQNLQLYSDATFFLKFDTLFQSCVYRTHAIWVFTAMIVLRSFMVTNLIIVAAPYSM